MKKVTLRRLQSFTSVQWRLKRQSHRRCVDTPHPATPQVGTHLVWGRLLCSQILWGDCVQLLAVTSIILFRSVVTRSHGFLKGEVVTHVHHLDEGLVKYAKTYHVSLWSLRISYFNVMCGEKNSVLLNQSIYGPGSQVYINSNVCSKVIYSFTSLSVTMHILTWTSSLGHVSSTI